MNLEFLKSKNSKIVLGLVALFIVIGIIVAVVSSSNNDSENPFLVCSADREMENIFSTNMTFNLYKVDDGIKLSQNIKLSAVGQLTSYSEAIYNNVAKKMKEDYEYLSKLDYVDYNVTYNDDYVLFNIDYNITAESNEQVIDQYGYDFLNSSDEDIKNYFEGVGYICQNS